MKKLYISEILLLSRKERKAKKVSFDPKRTVIIGTNSTGKSSLVKSIFRTFGAETVMHHKFKDAKVTSLVRFKIGNDDYQILRDGKRYSIFDGDDNFIRNFDSVTYELAPFLGEIFDFEPIFESRNGKFIVPPPAFLFLPFYMDQDNSWSHTWSAFKNLMQFKKYRNNCIYYHSGLRPNEYYRLNEKIGELQENINVLDNEYKTTKKILSDVQGRLSQSEFNIDIDAFRIEIKNLLIELEKLKKLEESVRKNLHEKYHYKVVYESQINIVKKAIKENQKDLRVLTDDLPDIVSCPTCGAEYENDFSVRFDIAADEQRSHELLTEISKEYSDLIDEIQELEDKLTETSLEKQNVDEILNQKKGELTLKDVIDSSGKNQVRDIFTDKHSELKSMIFDASRAMDKFEKKLGAIVDIKRKNEIIDYFRSTFEKNLNSLDVTTLDKDQYKSILTVIENKETGSSLPRALIAYFFTFLNVIKKYSDSAFCPIVIDSPNQQEQDEFHIDKIMKFINKNQPDDTQIILSLTDTHGEDFDCKYVKLENKYSLLQADQYDSIYNELKDKLSFTWGRFI